MELRWEQASELRVNAEHGTTIISANRAGLRSLAAHLMALAEERPGSHIHYDAYNALAEGSEELIVERVE